MKMLFIPHSPNITLVNRVYEFAKHSESYFLYWYLDNSSFKNKLRTQFYALSTPFKQQGELLTMPLLFRPDAIAPRLNTYLLNRLIKQYKIDVVVNANALLFDIAAIEVPVIYDLVDDHLTPNSDIGLTPKRVEKVKKDIQNSAGVICVTAELEEKVKILNPNTTVVENGLHLERFEKALSLKKKLSLEEKQVYGYIGGVDAWTGIDKAIVHYLRIATDKTAMIVVGDSNSSFFTQLKQQYKNDVLFIGKVPPNKVGDYFKTLDFGLIPFVLNDFTNNAYPIKALEYGLAGATVLSTPLKVLKNKNFPFINFCYIEHFSECMRDIKPNQVTFNFSNMSWQVKTNTVLQFIHNQLKHPNEDSK